MSYLSPLLRNGYDLIRKSYYLDSLAENATGGGAALTFEEMTCQESFDGFDFDTVWAISPNSNYPFLYLREVGNEGLNYLELDYIIGEHYEISGRSFCQNIDYYAEECDSSIYNPILANMMAALSQAVYSESDIESAYRALGFGEQFDVYDFDGEFNPLSCGYALSFKKSDYSDDTICLVSVRGSNNKSDWHGNFIIETDSDGNHIGFEAPASRIYRNIQNQINDNNISGNVKYVITGHSRGAAVANLLSVKLMENGESSSDIYNYNFACPDVACKVSFSDYDNIYNLCNRADIVPLVPGPAASSLTTAGTSWGKYGKTYWFTKDNNIKNIKDRLVTNHNMNNYLEFFDSKSRPSDWGKSSADKRYDVSYKLSSVITKVFCPVDVVVTDKQGNKMASVIGGDVTYYNDYCGAVLIFTNGDRKVISVYGNLKFNVNLVGTDSGKMTYAVEELDLLTEEVVESKTFSNVTLEEGKTMYSPVSNAETTQDVELLLVNNEDQKTITHKIDVDGTESRIFLSINKPETRTIYVGESIRLSAHANLPAEYKIRWKVDGEGVKIKPSASGKNCTVTSTSTGNVVIKAYIVDSSEKTVYDENGKQICDSEYFYSEDNLILRIINFFKKLFGINR